jgi:predicted enzyme related to lactoylglutathione lyase
MSHFESIDYLEYPSNNFADTKAFFEAVFAWRFTDDGTEYMAFEAKGLQGGGGFYKTDLASKFDQGGALAVFYSENLKATQARVEAAGGTIVKSMFSFPGGSRFHFEEPSGNQFAVWTHQ